MPTAASLLERGVSGPVEGADAPAVAWATAMTGATPLRHGIHGPYTLRPDGAGIEPLGADGWQAPPLWQLLAEAGLRVATVNAPGTAPATTTTWPGLIVDDRFASPPAPGETDWPLPPRCVHPARLRDTLRPLRLHPGELDAGLCAGLPAPALAEAVSVQSVALHLLQHESPDVLVVVHPIGGQMGGGQMGGGQIGTDDGLAFLDTLLHHLVAAAGPEADVLVTDPGGFILAAGPSFPADELRHGLAAADIAATVLARFGLRAATGRCLARPNGRTLHAPPPPAIRPDRPAPPPPDTADARRAVDGVIVQTGMGRSTALLAAGDPAAAADALEPALALRPGDPGLLLLLGQCRFFGGDWAACETVGAALDAAAPALPWGPMLRGAAQAGAGHPLAAAPLLASAAVRAAGSKPALQRLGAIALHLGDAATARDHYAAAHALAPPDPDSAAGLGLAHLALGDLAAGEALLRQSLGIRFQAPALHHQLGLLYARQHRWRDADDALAIALAQQPDLEDAATLRRRVRAAVLGAVGPA